MNRIKNFFYDKSDIIVALIILAIAAGVIFWRLLAIMDYPKQLANENNSHIVTDVDISNQQQSDVQQEQTGTEGQQGENQQGENQQSEAQNPDDPFAGVVPQGNENTSEPTGIWKDGKLTQSVTVEVKGSTAKLAINCLVDAGLFDSYSEYEDICEDLGYNPEQVYAGSFTFNKGATKEIIVNKVNLGN